MAANYTKILEIGLNTPPVNPDAGDSFIVGQTPEGAWTRLAGRKVTWYPPDQFPPDGEWISSVLEPGLLYYNAAAGTFHVFEDGILTEAPPAA